MELKPYIISHGVCKEWKRLLPLIEMHPIRNRLLELYRLMLRTPCFLGTREWIVKNLQPFDRQAYVDALLSQYPFIPEDFRMWILEWPARMAIDCMWPGLPFVDYREYTLRRRYGVNWMGYRPDSPQLYGMVYRQGQPNAKFIPAMLIWKGGGCHDVYWLLFDHEHPKIFGRVILLQGCAESLSDLPYESDDDESNSYMEDKSYSDWMDFQQSRWERHTEWASRPKNIDRFQILDPDADDSKYETPIDRPVNFDFDYYHSHSLLCPPWVERESLESQKCLNHLEQ